MPSTLSKTPAEEGTTHFLIWTLSRFDGRRGREAIVPDPQPGGVIMTVALGIVGALLGGWIGGILGLYQEGQPAGFIMAVIGALMLLAVYHLVATRSFLVERRR
jgi:uncharacterized membrane protein YeaQ/YmgE (transglycosylase-associated protein family)